MQLVKVRPIPLPVFKGGRGWYDDFAVTGARDPNYVLSDGTRSTIAGGISLKASISTVGQITLPIWFKAAHFRAEIVAKLAAGNRAVFEFRSLDSNNRLMLRLLSSNTLDLVKVVLSASTSLASIAGVTASTYQRLGLEVCGPSIKVFLNGKQVIAVTDSDLINNTKIGFWCYDAATGAAESHWQYLAIHPL